MMAERISGFGLSRGATHAHGDSRGLCGRVRGGAGGPDAGGGGGRKGGAGEERKPRGVTMDGNKFTLIEGRKKQETVTFTLREKDSQKVIEFHTLKDKEKIHWHGIYEFDGDKLKVCWGPAGQERPKEVEAKKADDHRYFILEKSKK